MTASEKAKLFVDDFVRDIVLETKRTMAECSAALHVNRKEVHHDEEEVSSRAGQSAAL